MFPFSFRSEPTSLKGASPVFLNRGQSNSDAIRQVSGFSLGRLSGPAFPCLSWQPLGPASRPASGKVFPNI